MRGILLKQTPKQYVSPVSAPYIKNIDANLDWVEQKIIKNDGKEIIYFCCEIPNLGVQGHNKGNQLFVHFYVLEDGVYKMTHGLPVDIGHTIIIKPDGTVRIEVGEKISGRLVILGFTTEVIGGNI